MPTTLVGAIRGNSHPHAPEARGACRDSGAAFPEMMFNPRNALVGRTHDQEPGDLGLIWNRPRAADLLSMEFCFLSRKIRA